MKVKANDNPEVARVDIRRAVEKIMWKAYALCMDPLSLTSDQVTERLMKLVDFGHGENETSPFPEGFRFSISDPTAKKYAQQAIPQRAAWGRA